MNALPPEDLRGDYEDFARPSDSVKEAGWRLYARKLIERIAALKQECDDLRKEIVHLSHCNFGENEGSCKYGEDDCPALSESWSWFGKALQERDQLRAEVERLSAPVSDEEWAIDNWKESGGSMRGFIDAFISARRKEPKC